MVTYGAAADVETRLMIEAHQMVGLAQESQATLHSITAILVQYLEQASRLLQRYAARPRTPTLCMP